MCRADHLTADVSDARITFHAQAGRPLPQSGFTPYERINRETEQPVHDESLLSELARKMAEWPARWGKYRFDAVGIPAAYTYLGQLVAHDLTWNAPPAGRSSICFRAACLDFGSLLACDPGLCPAPSVAKREGIALGCTSTGAWDDIARTPSGAPAHGDSRIDQNLALSQLAVLVIKFHQVLSSRTADKANARLDARRHLQWIVLHDFLPRIIDPVVYRDVIRSAAYPLLGAGPGLIPIEFAAASFRLGHAMVRYRYPHWRRGGGGAGLQDLLHFTHHSAASRLVDIGGEVRLPDEWVAGWSFLLPQEGDETRVSRSAAIDENLALDMFALPDTIGDCLMSAPRPEGTADGSFNLAEHTLIRGNRLRLASAQSLSALAQRRLKEAGAAPLPRRLPTLRIAQTRAEGLGDFLMSDAATPLRTDTPLWFYFLREADVHASGQHFGPLASRITMETIYRAIQSDPDGILQSDFKPDFADPTGKFGLKDLHNAVQTHWSDQP